MKPIAGLSVGKVGCLAFYIAFVVYIGSFLGYALRVARRFPLSTIFLGN